MGIVGGGNQAIPIRNQSGEIYSDDGMFPNSKDNRYHLSQGKKRELGNRYKIIRNLFAIT